MDSDKLLAEQGVGKVKRRHRYLVKRNRDRALVGSTNDLGIILPPGYQLIDTIGEDGLGPGIWRFVCNYKARARAQQGE